MRHTVIHEFQHHLESLAGEDGLAVEDARKMARYKRGDYFFKAPDSGRVDIHGGVCETDMPVYYKSRNIRRRQDT